MVKQKKRTHHCSNSPGGDIASRNVVTPQPNHNDTQQSGIHSRAGGGQDVGPNVLKLIVEAGNCEGWVASQPSQQNAAGEKYNSQVTAGSLAAHHQGGAHRAPASPPLQNGVSVHQEKEPDSQKTELANEPQIPESEHMDCDQVYVFHSGARHAYDAKGSQPSQLELIFPPVIDRPPDVRDRVSEDEQGKEGKKREDETSQQDDQEESEESRENSSAEPETEDEEPEDREQHQGQAPGPALQQLLSEGRYPVPQPRLEQGPFMTFASFGRSALHGSTSEGDRARGAGRKRKNRPAGANEELNQAAEEALRGDLTNAVLYEDLMESDGGIIPPFSPGRNYDLAAIRKVELPSGSHSYMCTVDGIEVEFDCNCTAPWRKPAGRQGEYTRECILDWMRSENPPPKTDKNLCPGYLSIDCEYNGSQMWSRREAEIISHRTAVQEAEQENDRREKTRKLKKLGPEPKSFRSQHSCIRYAGYRAAVPELLLLNGTRRERLGCVELAIKLRWPEESFNYAGFKEKEE